MARRAVIEALILKEAWGVSLNWTSLSLFHSSRCGNRIIRNVRDFCSGRRTDRQINCSRDKNLRSSPSLVTENMQEPPPEADLQTISDTRKIEGNVEQTTNMVFGSTVTDGSTGEWLTLNEKLNTYPSARRFTAIGMGGDDFVRSMVVAVESVIQHQVPQGYVKQRVSSGGKYVSVNIGPVRVISREQVQAVYNAMRSDERMKFFL
ncbi:hypothetical protein L1987_11237 [Smallanthus sonchifolius]|uniref:Uncharacterized protein n=1 Tax=Smallanthus sonchifolius TaxID=185202 RepID=A0ACB9JBB0_9ASTR|nr:hypothetical protein L1987_11237 [Smallanthus sonchifolius]